MTKKLTPKPTLIIRTIRQPERKVKIITQFTVMFCKRRLFKGAIAGPADETLIWKEIRENPEKYVCDEETYKIYKSLPKAA